MEPTPANTGSMAEEYWFAQCWRWSSWRSRRDVSASRCRPIPWVTLVDWTYGFNVTTAVLPMVTGDGTYAGVLIVALDPSLYYESLVHSYEPAEKYDVWIVDEAGYVIHSPNHDLQKTKISVI